MDKRGVITSPILFGMVMGLVIGLILGGLITYSVMTGKIPFIGG